MFLRAVFILTILLVTTPSNHSSRRISSNDEYILYEGRHEILDNNVAFDHPGFKICLNISVTSRVSILLSAITVVPHRFWIYVDGTLLDSIIDTKVMLNNTLTEFPINWNLDPFKSHSICVVKVTEAQWNSITPEPNYVTFAGFLVDDSAKILPNKINKRKIEFIGDSIQAGFCNMCNDIDDEDYAKESFAAAHPYITCANLDATCQTAAWSGYGVVRNCCGGETLMPEIYSRTLASVPGSQWTFTDWQPEVVVVNLGDNDGLDRTNPTGDYEVAFVASYTDMIRNIAISYKDSNPTFFLSCGPMSFGYCTYVQAAISTLKAENIPVNYIEFPPFGDPKKRCCGHPSAEAHVQMASQLTNEIANVMKW